MGTRVQLSDISYLGYFNLPGLAGEATMNYGGFGMSIGPDNTLYVGGHVYYGRIGRFTIPSDPINGKTATTHTSPVQVPGTFSGGNEQIGGSVVAGTRLIVTKYMQYGADCTASHASSSLTMTGWTTPQNNTLAREGAGYMAPIPTGWQSAFGATHVGGTGCRSIDAGCSFGPSLYTFNPSDVDGSGTISVTQCLFYDYAHRHRVLGSADPGDYGFNEAHSIGAVFWVPNTDSVIFYGISGAGHPDYKSGGSGGFDDLPTFLAFWAYDANDLLAVKNGTKALWEPLPYSNTNPYRSWATPTFGANQTDPGFNGISGAFDPATSRFYGSVNWAETPRIHVWQFTSFGSTPPTGTITLSVR